MRIVAIGIVKNEIDIATTWARHVLRVCDALTVLDDGSTDGTIDALRKAGARVIPIPHPPFNSAAVTRLMHGLQSTEPADLYVPIDADELPFMTRAELEAASEAERIPAMRMQTYVRIGDLFYPYTHEHGMVKCLVPGRLALAVKFPAHISSHRVETLEGERLPSVPVGRGGHFPLRSIEQAISKIVQGMRMLLCEPGLRPGEGAHVFQMYEYLCRAEFAPSLAALTEMLAVPPGTFEPDMGRPYRLELAPFAPLVPTLAELVVDTARSVVRFASEG